MTVKLSVDAILEIVHVSQLTIVQVNVIVRQNVVVTQVIVLVNQYVRIVHLMVKGC